MKIYSGNADNRLFYGVDRTEKRYSAERIDAFNMAVKEAESMVSAMRDPAVIGPSEDGGVWPR